MTVISHHIGIISIPFTSYKHTYISTTICTVNAKISPLLHSSGVTVCRVIYKNNAAIYCRI